MNYLDATEPFSQGLFQKPFCHCLSLINEKAVEVQAVLDRKKSPMEFYGDIAVTDRPISWIGPLDIFLRIRQIDSTMAIDNILKNLQCIMPWGIVPVPANIFFRVNGYLPEFLNFTHFFHSSSKYFIIAVMVLLFFCGRGYGNGNSIVLYNVLQVLKRLE